MTPPLARARCYVIRIITILRIRNLRVRCPWAPSKVVHRGDRPRDLGVKVDPQSRARARGVPKEPRRPNRRATVSSPLLLRVRLLLLIGGHKTRRMCQEDWNSIHPQDKGNSRGKFTGLRNVAPSPPGDVNEITNKSYKGTTGSHRARRIVHFCVCV